jgi:hypothetical protein
MSSSVLTLQIPGTLATSSEVKVVAPVSGKITGAYVAVTTAPVGSALTANLLVGANTAGAFSVAAAATTDEATLTAVNCSFSKGDVITLDVTAVGSSTAGANAVASLEIEVEAEETTPITISPDNRFGQPA